MFRLLVSFGLAALLVGCSSNNAGTNTLQYSPEARDYPYGYQIEAARVVQERDADPGFVRVSRPMTTLGETVLSPRRWFVCVRGIPAPAPPSGFFAAVAQVFRAWFGPKDPGGIVYDVVLFFSGEQEVSIRDGFDLPLCQGLEFEFITAEPPGV
jgi:hypothetical protein